MLLDEEPTAAALQAKEVIVARKTTLEHQGVLAVGLQLFDNFSKICDSLSEFPLSFCHGDLKSPNIFYRNSREPYYLDWQYIHLYCEEAYRDHPEMDG